MSLRVTHIVTQLELGGAQRNTLYTISHLDRSRFEPSLLCGPGGILDKETKTDDWTTLFIRWLVRPVRPWKDILALIQLYRHLRKIKPHIVHTHSSKAGILGRVAAYLAGIPVIIHTFHGFGFNNRQRPWTRWFFVRMEKMCAWLSTHLVFVSEENRKEAKERRIGLSRPNSLIRSGIKFGGMSKSDVYSPERRGADKVHRVFKGIPQDAWRVLYIGNFKPQKNPLDLARVANEVIKVRPNTHFLFAGEGELQRSVEDWCKDYGILEHVHFLGWCRRHDDIERLLAGSHCFLMTSLWEGLPRALVEAFAAGKPAVAYGVDGIRDILLDEKTGFLIPPGDVSLAAEKIVWLSDHPEKAQQMGKRAAELVTSEFDIDKMVKDQEALYEALYEKVPLKSYYESLWNVGSQNKTS